MSYIDAKSCLDIGRVNKPLDFYLVNYDLYCSHAADGFALTNFANVNDPFKKIMF
jgi:hypothetical protein